jgi:hypothetical protein
MPWYTVDFKAWLTIDVEADSACEAKERAEARIYDRLGQHGEVAELIGGFDEPTVYDDKGEEVGDECDH